MLFFTWISLQLVNVLPSRTSEYNLSTINKLQTQHEFNSITPILLYSEKTELSFCGVYDYSKYLFSDFN